MIQTSLTAGLAHPAQRHRATTLSQPALSQPADTRQQDNDGQPSHQPWHGSRAENAASPSERAATAEVTAIAPPPSMLQMRILELLREQAEQIDRMPGGGADEVR